MPSLFFHGISVVRVYLSTAATTQDPAGRGPCQWCKLVVEFHFFACSCPDLPTPFVEEAVFTAKEIILKIAREKQIVMYKGVPLRPSADFSKETLQARRDWQEVFKVVKSRDLQSR